MPRIKRFKERPILRPPLDNGFPIVVKEMLDDLAEHIERTEERQDAIITAIVRVVGAYRSHNILGDARSALSDIADTLEEMLPPPPENEPVTEAVTDGGSNGNPDETANDREEAPEETPSP